MATDYDSAFVRQRRSLLIISIVLAALLYFGLQGSEVRVGPGGGSGLMVDVLDHRNVYAGLGVLWAWWLVRYLQFFWKIRKDKLRELREDQLPYIKKLVAPLFEERAVLQLQAEAARRFKPEAKIVVTAIQPEGDFRRDEWHRLRWRYTGLASASVGTHSSGAVPVRAQLEIVGFELKWLLSRATFWPTLRHVYFSEYVVPLLIAMVPVVVAVSRWSDLFLPTTVR